MTWLRQFWQGGAWQKAIVLFAIPIILCCGCCGAWVTFAASPLGQRIVAEGEATSTAQAIAQAQATQQAKAYLAAHPTATDGPTATDQPSPTDQPTQTPQPAVTAIPTAVPTATLRPTATPRPAPQPTATPKPKPTCSTDGAPANPWCYTFANTGKLIYSPASAFCDYFPCIASFWSHTNGYVEECQDGDFSHSGGVRGSCSYHGGNKRPLYRP